MTNRGFGRWLVLSVGAAALLAVAELGVRARYRYRILPKVTAPGTITVVALGDSIVAGSPGFSEDAWPARLAARLQASYPAVTWRVVNAGVPGDTAPLGYARFDADAASAGPQLVLIAFGLNDCNPARYGLDRWFEKSVPQDLPEQSYLWRAAQVRIGRLGRRAGWLAGPQPESDPALAARTSPTGFVAALATLTARAREIGARPILLTMTPLAGTGTPEVEARAATYRGYNALIRERAARRDVPLVELANGAPPAAFEPDGLHLTRAGQMWVASQVYDQLDGAGVWARLAREANR